MADLIDRQAAIDAVKKLTKWYYETYHETRPTCVAVVEELMDLPSAQPEIIRCKDCKHYKDGECTNTFWGMCERDFCSEGERKEE